MVHQMDHIMNTQVRRLLHRSNEIYYRELWYTYAEKKTPPLIILNERPHDFLEANKAKKIKRKAWPLKEDTPYRKIKGRAGWPLSIRRSMSLFHGLSGAGYRIHQGRFIYYRSPSLPLGNRLSSWHPKLEARK